VRFAVAAILAVAIAVLAALVLPPLLRRRRRRRTLLRPLDPALQLVLERNVQCLQPLPAALRPRLEGLINIFLDEKEFVGCNGQVITDEIRITIAAQACLLLLGRPGRVYDELQSILVYPSVFWVEDEVEGEDGVVTRRRRELSGEAWDSHRIILSWEDIEETAQVPADGYNVVLHEFAHYLDAEGLGLAPGGADGPRSLDAWLAGLRQQYAVFVQAVSEDAPVFLDPYAAEDEAEFFAVATEDFIERPVEFRAANAEHYNLMREFYGIDPAAWRDADLSRAFA
jgi:Mlc titration factor MtfA (ptsG expression regulator)